MEVQLSDRADKLARRLLKLSRGLETEFDSSQAAKLRGSLEDLSKLEPPRGMESLFSRLGRIEPTDIQRVIEISVGLEHLLGLSLKDENIVVRHSDHDAPLAITTLPFSVALENLRSAFNVGSILRTCENFGAESVHLIGYTPEPASKAVRKTALGAEEYVQTAMHRSIDHLLESTKHPVVAFETVEGAENFYNVALPANPVFLFGNERFGLSTETLQKCDKIVRIPMQGRKNSMNVANSVAAALGYYCSRMLK